MRGLPDSVAGIVGLAVGNTPRDDYSGASFALGEQFLDYLKMAGVISSKEFSTHLSAKNSFIDFGASEFGSEKDAVTLQFEDGYFWNIVPQGIRFGLPEDQMEF